MASWTSDERVGADGAVRSEQRLFTERAVVPSSKDGAQELGRAYWDTVEKYSCPFVQVRRRADGGIDIRPLAGPAFLRLGPADVSVGDDGVTCRYPDRGRHADAAAGRRDHLSATRQRRRVHALLGYSGLYPTLAARPGRPEWTGAFYTLGQSRLHVALGRTYDAAARRS